MRTVDPAAGLVEEDVSIADTSKLRAQDVSTIMLRDDDRCFLARNSLALR
jgi:hypothetical protein